MTPLNTSEFLKIYEESWQFYLTDIQHYREVVMLLYIGLTKNANRMIENAIEFVEGMILSRLIMLIFN
jgi:predicted AAA+ superfamily ATPase